MNCLDLCAGAGGLSLGLAAAGFDVLGLEMDRNAHLTHLQIGPCLRGDIALHHPAQDYDLVAGGPPCQPFSLCGDREGLNGEKGLLYRHVIRCALESRALGILIENVRGLLSWDDGWALDHILADLQIAGFDPEFRLLDCSDYGVPQSRHRVFVVAFRDGLGPFQWPEPWAQKMTVREALGLRGNFKVGRIPKHPRRRSNGTRWMDPDKPSYSITGSSNQDFLWPVGWQGHRAIDVDLPSPTIVAGTNQDFLYARDVSASGARRLTVQEAAALQTFPVGIRYYGNKDEQYKQVGNAVPPLMAYQLGLAIRQRWNP